MPYAIPYAKYILLAAPVNCATFVLNNTLRSEGFSRLAMLGVGTGGVPPLRKTALRFGLAGGLLPGFFKVDIHHVRCHNAAHGDSQNLVTVHQQDAVHAQGFIAPAGLGQGDVFQHVVSLRILLHAVGIPVVDHVLGHGHVAGCQRNHGIIRMFLAEPVGVVALFLIFSAVNKTIVFHSIICK